MQYCSLTTDLWASRATMGFMTVSRHFLTSDWDLKSVILETIHIEGSHTAVSLADALKKITDE